MGGHPEHSRLARQQAGSGGAQPSLPPFSLSLSWGVRMGLAGPPPTPPSPEGRDRKGEEGGVLHPPPPRNGVGGIHHPPLEPLQSSSKFWLSRKLAARFSFFSQAK